MNLSCHQTILQITEETVLRRGAYWLSVSPKEYNEDLRIGAPWESAEVGVHCKEMPCTGQSYSSWGWLSLRETFALGLRLGGGDGPSDLCGTFQSRNSYLNQYLLLFFQVF